MKTGPALVLLWVLLVQAAGASAALPQGQAGHPNVAGEKVFEWPSWSRDSDGNGLDDELEYWLAELDRDSFPVVMCYGRMPARAEQVALEVLGGKVGFVSSYLPYLTARLPYNSVKLARELPGVVRIEAATPYGLTMDSAVPSIHIDDVWMNFGLRGEGQTICIIDSGIDANHTDFGGLGFGNASSKSKVVAFYDAANSPEVTDGSTRPFDLDGHGTNVAGIAAGTGRGEPDYKYIGVAPAARLVGVKILQNGSSDMSTSDALRGIEWAMTNQARFGIKVLSMSFGAKFVAPGITNDGNSAMSQLCNQAVQQGLVCVAAAGNSGPLRRSISPPGDARDVITVGNVQDDHSLNPSSSRGPVGRYLSSYIKPDVCAPGTDVYSAEANTGNKFVSQTGTSQACPNVAGVTALMLEAQPSLRPSDIVSILRSTAEPGRVFPLEATPNNDYGYGTVNALRAVENCTNGTLPPVVTIDPLERANGTVLLTGTASSRYGSIRSVEVRIDSGTYRAASGTALWSYSWNTTAHANGAHLISARAFDGDQYSYEYRIVVEVDNLLVAIAPLPAAGVISGEYLFSGTTEGPGIQSVEVRIDNRSWESAEDTSGASYRTWRYRMNTAALSNGIHHLEARAFDGSKYSPLTELDFNVNNPPGPTPAKRFIPGLEAAFAALVLLTALVLGGARRGRR